MPCCEVAPTRAHTHIPFPGSDRGSHLVFNVFLPLELGVLTASIQGMSFIAKSMYFKDQFKMELPVSFYSEVLIKRRKILRTKDYLEG